MAEMVVFPNGSLVGTIAEGRKMKREMSGVRHVLAAMAAVLSMLLLLIGCDGRTGTDLPVLGQVDRDFLFHDQANQPVTPALFAGKVYVTDFFFTSCPSICPIMKRQMVRVYEVFRDDPDVLLLSHSIDPEHDTVEVLRNYADGLGIETDKWHLVTGDQEQIFAMAKHYMLAAMKHDEAPGGYLHSGSFVLVDNQGRIRGYYDGTDTKEVDQLIDDLKGLLRRLR
ncbi:SCO family protein [Desulfofustis limnaeus]|jgi:protein SCO1/2|uniref:Thioredoxin domain-containing protein n=1 Tax=Desulfofustis limnaeus TaxID=2740163 RepID=A0ABN6M020_9BACT|nr:SCO family protein [Desulfofustis limnaeus]MDX9894624.1 SCO family protein [Desulfofustis sp.]BDD86231.1 hypothetical protein DPPLL_05960 [Desulfofustis limnaeus]